MMDLKWKSSAILLTTLLLGIVIGIFLSGTINWQRRVRSTMPMGPRGLNEMVLEAVGPLSPEIADSVRTVVTATETRIHQTFRESHLTINANLDTMRQQLSRFLTEDQMQQLQQDMERKRRWMNRQKDRFAPGPPPEHHRGHRPPPCQPGPDAEAEQPDQS